MNYSYDLWKTTNPDDEWLGPPEPDLEQQIEAMEERLAREGDLDAEVEWESRF